MPLEVAQIRRHVQSRLADVKRAAEARRDRVAAAERAYTAFLSNVAIPTFTTFAQALTAENHPYRVTTPGTAVRLESERSNRTFVDLHLDTSLPVPAVIAEVSRQRGSRVATDEHPIAEGVAIDATTDEHVLEFLLELVADLVER
ncbi:MAG: hypothetical protein WCP29_14410 [Acidobacteriota bacterium]